MKSCDQYCKFNLESAAKKSIRMKRKIYVIAAFLFYAGIYNHSIALDADTAFRQPVSVKYQFSEDLRGSVLKKVVVDYNDNVYVLTR